MPCAARRRPRAVAAAGGAALARAQGVRPPRATLGRRRCVPARLRARARAGRSVRPDSTGRTARVRHVAAAEWIESLPEDRSEDRAATLAHHYVTATRPASARPGEDVVMSCARVRPARCRRRESVRSRFPRSARLTDSSSRALELLPDGRWSRSAQLLFAAGQASGFVGRERRRAAARGATPSSESGDLERAAEGAVAASWHLWHVRPDEASRGSSVQRRSSRVGRRHARRRSCVAEQARREMLAYNRDAALRLAIEAVALAEAIGDDRDRGRRARNGRRRDGDRR